MRHGSLFALWDLGAEQPRRHKINPRLPLYTSAAAPVQKMGAWRECDLMDDVLEYVAGGVGEERLEGLEVDALLQDRLERPLRLGLEVLRRVGAQVHRQQPAQDVEDGGGLGVVGAVPADLAERPGAGGLDVVLGLADQRVDQRRDALGHNHAHGQRLAEGRDIAERHDARQPRIAPRLVDVVHHSRDPPGVDNKPRQLRRVLSNLSDTCCRVLAHLQANALSLTCAYQKQSSVPACRRP